MGRPGEVGGGAVGGGGGAGGFCADASGVRIPMASASSRRMRMGCFIRLFLGWERLSRNCSARFRSSQHSECKTLYQAAAAAPGGLKQRQHIRDALSVIPNVVRDLLVG